ncbi:hypothetical protein THRCLA_08025, partial [Thraustotheca clavata]
NIKAVGEWKAVNEDGRKREKRPTLNEKIQALTLPEIENNNTTPRPRIPQQIPNSPRPAFKIRDGSYEAKVQAMLVELHADPHAWAIFQTKVKEYVDSKKKRGKIIRENIEKCHNADKLRQAHEEKSIQQQKRVAQYRVKYQTQLETEHAYRVEQLDRHARQVNLQKRLLARRQQIASWLQVVMTVCNIERWHYRTNQEKSKKLLELHRLAAVLKIQRLWRRRIRVSNSKAIMQIIIKFRRILWSVSFRLHCKKLALAGSILRRFLVDYFTNGSPETGNFRVMMARWRWRVIHAQRASKDYIACTRARLHVLGQIWDRLDHERQKQERQRMMSKASIAMPETPPPVTPSPRRRPNRRNAAETFSDLSAIQEQLSAMQNMLTPIEIQRLHTHTYQVVRISKTLKLRLLTTYLAKRRVTHMREVAHYLARASADASNKKANAALLIQQNSTWLNKPPAPKYPTFSLYSSQTIEDIKQLIQEALRLSSESH